MYFYDLAGRRTELWTDGGGSQMLTTLYKYDVLGKFEPPLDGRPLTKPYTPPAW